MRRQILVALCLLLLASVRPAIAQTPTITSNVRQVLVPAVVADKKGHPVSNLQSSDFQVFEDDVPQHVVAFRKTYDSSLETPSALIANGTVIRLNAAPAAKVGRQHIALRCPITRDYRLRRGV